ncbi:MAG TPA: acetate--CoA ligase family protein [Candidatus Pacearchaeota archaeon]|nr:acetate--CoA ligase family protein [Candidatus Parcubacteria bacterium]HNZ83937.1 acetate--CoA ligase family protein [Candidatus Pacearchaeota archaeon]HOU45706.1 acetate--CoA ligase family protein [Candidatus Pacearchaeota archaeon]HPM08239.1 acetate--CoA ligase family protein [Candidatus Pacearchaeota archaeon]HQI74441.1 acetate--CoA ligase family protein [Candidatus Pacearchaeota archaeon]
MILNFKSTLELLKKYRINAGKIDIFEKPSEAVDFAVKAGYPVALKVFGENILHRTDIGGVSLNIDNDGKLYTEFARLSKISPTIICQKMIDGEKVIVGMKRDKQFGPVIMFGLGGIFVEILKDVSFRVCPINKKEAIEMIKEIKSYPILSGARGRKPVNIKALAEALVAISKLALEHEEIKEIDLNPIIVNQKEAVAIDFKFLI